MDLPPLENQIGVDRGAVDLSTPTTSVMNTSEPGAAPGDFGAPSIDTAPCVPLSPRCSPSALLDSSAGLLTYPPPPSFPTTGVLARVLQQPILTLPANPLPIQDQEAAAGDPSTPSFGPAADYPDVNASAEASPQPLSAPARALPPAEKPADDHYTWRKYGQKEVKGGEYPRSYFKCTHPDCPVRKKIERSRDGKITEIFYNTSHTHPPPNPPAAAAARDSQSGVPSPACTVIGIEDSGILVGPLVESSNVEEEDDDCNREEGSFTGPRRMIKEKLVIQTESEADNIEDGYQWRKYGEKVVKGNHNPKSYYKCTTPRCTVKKQVVRAAHDPKSLVMTYEGKHNHEVPAAKTRTQNAAKRNSVQGELPKSKSKRKLPDLATNPPLPSSEVHSRAETSNFGKEIPLTLPPNFKRDDLEEPAKTEGFDPTSI